MSKRSVAYLILAAVLLTAFSLALSRRDSTDWRANRSRRLFPFPWQDTTAIRIAKPNGYALDFAKNPRGEWQIKLPDDLADTLSNLAVDEFTALATLTWREPLKEGKAPNPEQATVITATSLAGQRLELTLGEASNNLRAVTVDGDAANVYGVSQDFLTFLDWPEDRFRKFTLANAGTGQRPNQVVLMPAGGDTDLRVTLRQEPEGWRQVEPVEWPADAVRLDLLLRWVERLRAESIEAEMSADLEWFGFTKDSAYVEARYDGPDGGQTRRVEFGGDAGEGRVYVRETSRNPIFAVPQSTLAEISLDAANDYQDLWKNFYRRRVMNAVGEELPAEITVERLLPTPARLTIAHTRDRDGDKWRGALTERGETRTFAIDAPDAQDAGRPMSALITGLSSLRVKAFLTDTAPGPDTARWTAFPAWRFTSKSADGRENHTVTLYAADADGTLPPGQPFAEGKAGPADMTPKTGMPENAGIAFGMDDKPVVMEMHGDLAYLLCLPPYRYQTRRLNDYDPRGWKRVEIAAKGDRTVYTRNPGEVNEQWWRGDSRDEPLMDDNNIFVSLLLELSQLRADGFVSDAGGGVTEFGLDRPEITAIVYVSAGEGGVEEGDGRLFALAIGEKADPDGRQYFARLNDDGPVFLIPGRLAEALGREYR